MNFYVHLAIAVLATAYFLYRFIKDHKVYQFIFLLWIPSTLLAYVSTDRTFLTVLSAVQIAMFCLVIFFLFRHPKKGPNHVNETLKEMTDTTPSDEAKENNDTTK